jgi:hypothetical protein
MAQYYAPKNFNSIKISGLMERNSLVLDSGWLDSSELGSASLSVSVARISNTSGTNKNDKSVYTHNEERNI